MTADGLPPASWRDDLAAALPGWIAARVLVGLAWLLNAVAVSVRFDGADPLPTRLGLFAWDGSWYRDLAELGYGAVHPEGIRFHPLVPVLGVDGPGIVLLANLSALLAAAVLHRLVVEVVGDADVARRAATLLALAPPAFTLVWAYSEAPFLLISAGQLLALQRRRWWAAAGLGVLASLTRPVGLLLAIPAAIEALRTWKVARSRSSGTRGPSGPWGPGALGRAAAVAGPALGMAGFLLWVQEATGDWYRPLRIQSDLRDGFVLPPLRLFEGLGEVLTDPLGDGLHIPFAVAMVALLWVCWRHLPASWTALATVSVVSNLAAGNLNSIERYAFATVPLLVALAVVLGGRWWRPGLAISGAGFVGMAVLAWQGDFVP